jgi:hypothetical protein
MRIVTMKVPATLTVTLLVEGDEEMSVTPEVIRAALESYRRQLDGEIPRVARGGGGDLDVFMPGGDKWLNVTEVEVEVEPYDVSDVVSVETR